MAWYSLNAERDLELEKAVALLKGWKWIVTLGHNGLVRELAPDRWIQETDAVLWDGNTDVPECPFLEWHNQPFFILDKALAFEMLEQHKANLSFDAGLWTASICDNQAEAMTASEAIFRLVASLSTGHWPGCLGPGPSC